MSCPELGVRPACRVCAAGRHSTIWTWIVIFAAAKFGRNNKESDMLVRTLAGLAVFSLFIAGIQTMAQEPNVPLPKMPEGAGKADADAPMAFAKTASGLQYRILRKGTGANPKASNKVRVNYHGWLDDGKVFDSSYQ